MSKSCKTGNFYILPLKNTKKKEYLINIQEAIQHRYFQSDTHKNRSTQDYSNSEMIVTRKNQNLFMKILSSALYNNIDVNKPTNRNIKNKENAKDFQMLLEDELDMEDLDEWDYERFMVKINEKINN